LQAFICLRQNTLQLVEAKRTSPPCGAAEMISLRQRLLLDSEGEASTAQFRLIPCSLLQGASFAAGMDNRKPGWSFDGSHDLLSISEARIKKNLSKQQCSQSGWQQFLTKAMRFNRSELGLLFFR